MRKALFYNGYLNEKVTHFCPDKDTTLCAFDLEQARDCHNDIDFLPEDTKKKVNCPNCITIVEACKNTKKAEYKKLSELDD